MDALTTLERIGGVFVFVQALLTLPSIWRLFKDQVVEGMSIWTMGFYLFVSWYYVPVSYLAGLYWTMFGIALVGTAELVWCVWAFILIRRSKYD